METFNKQNLLENIRAGRITFDTLLGQFSNDQLLDAYPPDGWSVKDMMAHITYWENYALERLQEAANGSKPQLLGEVTDDEINRINQGILDAGADQTLGTVQMDYGRVFWDLQDLLEAMPEADDDPWWDLWPDHETVYNLIVFNTINHYEEHADDLQRWLAE